MNEVDSYWVDNRDFVGPYRFFVSLINLTKLFQSLTSPDKVTVLIMDTIHNLEVSEACAFPCAPEFGDFRHGRTGK